MLSFDCIICVWCPFFFLPCFPSIILLYLQWVHCWCWWPFLFLAVLEPRHTKAGAARENTINLIHTFRNYLHYHIKCSKVFSVFLHVCRHFNSVLLYVNLETWSWVQNCCTVGMCVKFWITSATESVGLQSKRGRANTWYISLVILHGT